MGLHLHTASAGVGFWKQKGRTAVAKDWEKRLMDPVSVSVLQGEFLGLTYTSCNYKERC